MRHGHGPKKTTDSISSALFQNPAQRRRHLVQQAIPRVEFTVRGHIIPGSPCFRVTVGNIFGTTSMLCYGKPTPLFSLE